MANWSLFLAIHGLHLIADAANASSHLYSLVKPPENPLHERSTGLYAAVLGGGSFEAMFENNKAIMSASCSQWGLPNNSDDETNSIKDAILEVEQSSGVDARFILSIVMQESKGCVRVQTTDNGVINPGLMQSHEGSGSCNRDGAIRNPCPESEIHQMIMDGVEGTPTGPGLKQLIAQEGGPTDAASFYKAARAYNSGAVASSGNLGQGIATHCYASDIANRLLGWSDGPSLCAPNVIGLLTAAQWEGKSASACHRTAKTSHFRSIPSSHVYSQSSNPVASAFDSPYASGVATTPVVFLLARPRVLVATGTFNRNRHLANEVFQAQECAMSASEIDLPPSFSIFWRALIYAVAQLVPLSDQSVKKEIQVADRIWPNWGLHPCTDDQLLY